MNSSAPLFQPQSQEIQPIRLSDLISEVKGVINRAFGGYVWIVAEVSSVSRNRSGHWYFDLVETEEGINKAFVRGNLWAGIASRVIPRFEQMTGGPIAQGMELMLLVKVELHVQYGFSLTIYDINPEYTLGHLERIKQETIRRLQAEGVWDLNKSNKLPLLLQRIAVISSPTAAGWGDFKKQISQSKVGGLIQLELFPSMMQGHGTTQSINNALDSIVENLEQYDAVVIIRGGGSKMDLSAFDDYALCCLIANFPIPIITGIGHERDESVADMVAHTPHKTPTAVAEFLIRQMELVVKQLFNAEDRVTNVLQDRYKSLTEQVHKLSQTTHIALTRLERNATIQLNHLASETQEQLKLLLVSEQSKLDHFDNRISNSLERLLLVRNDLNKLEMQASLQLERLQAQLQLREKQHTTHSQQLIRLLTPLTQKLEQEQDQLERIIKLYDPHNIMRRGFLPVLKEGNTITRTSEIKEGDNLRILMLDGEVNTNVKSIKYNNHD